MHEKNVHMGIDMTYDFLLKKVTAKLPPIGRNGCLAMLSGVVFFAFLLGFAICYGVTGGGGGGGGEDGVDGGPSASARTQKNLASSSPNYIFVANNSVSCPPLR